MFPIRSFLILFSNFSFYRLILLSSLFSVYWPTYILFCFVYLFDSFFLPFSSWKAKEWGNKSIWLKSKRNGISKKSLMRISQRLLVLGGSAAERRKKVSCLALFRLRIIARSAISDHELRNGRCWNSKIIFFGDRAPALVTNPLSLAFSSRMATALKENLSLSFTTAFAPKADTNPSTLPSNHFQNVAELRGKKTKTKTNEKKKLTTDTNPNFENKNRQKQFVKRALAMLLLNRVFESTERSMEWELYCWLNIRERR